MALLENKDGKYVAPNAQTGAAALASADLTGKDLRVWVTDPSGAVSWTPDLGPLAKV